MNFNPIKCVLLDKVLTRHITSFLEPQQAYPDIQKKKEFVRPTKKKKELKPFTKIANNLGKNKPSPRSVVDAPKLVDIDPTPSRLPSDFFKRKEQSEEERRYLQSVEDAKREKEKELRSGIGGLLL